MNDPVLLWQADHKVHFANILLDNARQQFDNFLKNGGIRPEIIEDHEQSLYVIGIRAGHLDSGLAGLIGSAVHNLRSALDTALSTVVSSKIGDDRRTNFPVHETERELRASLNEGRPKICKECGFAETVATGNSRIAKRIPDLYEIIMNEFRPWKDENYSIWALSKLDNIEKHKMIPLMFGQVSIRNTKFAEKVPLVDEKGNVVAGRIINWHENIISLRTGEFSAISRGDVPIKISSPGTPSGILIFENSMPFGGESVFEVLDKLSDQVCEIIHRLEKYMSEK